MSKKTEVIVARYNSFIATDINQLYAKPSKEKKSAFEYLKAACNFCNGYQLRVGSPTNHFFSLGFLYDDKNGDTWLYYHTGRKRYNIPVNKVYKMGDGSYYIEERRC